MLGLSFGCCEDSLKGVLKMDADHVLDSRYQLVAQAGAGSFFIAGAAVFVLLVHNFSFRSARPESTVDPPPRSVHYWSG